MLTISPLVPLRFLRGSNPVPLVKDVGRAGLTELVLGAVASIPLGISSFCIRRHFRFSASDLADDVYPRNHQMKAWIPATYIGNSE